MAVTLNPSELIHIVTLQRPVRKDDSFGEQPMQWKNIKTLHASIKPKKAWQKQKALSVGMNVTHDVEVAYDPLVTGECRFIFKTRILNIVGICNPEERNIKLEIECNEVEVAK